MESAPSGLAAMSDEVRLTASQDVWVRLVEKDGTIFVEKILLRGEDLIASQSRGLSLMTNNAAALVLFPIAYPVSLNCLIGPLLTFLALLTYLLSCS